MHDNDVQLIRVYPREKEGTILERSIPSSREFEVVVEARAGKTLHGGGGKYFIQIVVRDLSDFTIVHNESLEGYFTNQPWDEEVLVKAFSIPAQGIAKENHVYEVLATLCVGLSNPNVSFANSPRFIIRKA